MEQFIFEKLQSAYLLLAEIVGYEQSKDALNRMRAEQFVFYPKGGDASQGQIDVNAQKVQNSNKNEDEDNMKYLTKRADGRWQGAKTIDGKRYFVYAKTKADCYEKLKKLSKRKPRKPSYTVKDFATYYLETYKKGNVVESTYKDYVSTVKNYLSINTLMTKATTSQLQDIINAMPLTRQRGQVYQLIKQIFKKAYDLDIIKKNVADALVKGKLEKSERRALNLEEQQALFNQLTDDIFSRRVLFYLCTGARPTEIQTVNKTELRPGWVKINGKKTAQSTRWVKISDKLYKMLKNAPEGFFKFDTKKFRLHLQRVAQKAGIKYDIDIYTLRHTFATNLYILRVPEKDRQTYMGHSAGSTMTNDVYTTFSPDITAQNIYDIYGDFLPEF